MSQVRCLARLSAITLGLLLAGCGDSQQSDWVAKMKALMGGQGAAPATVAEPDPQQAPKGGNFFDQFDTPSQQALQKVLDELRKNAEAGDADSQYKLGRRYSVGDGLPQDSAKAAEWYEKAAIQGHIKAQFHLGQLHFFSEPKDIGKALKWWQLAAEKGDAASQDFLGVLYFNGEGVNKDVAKAIDLARKAAAQGFEGAQFHLGLAYREGTGVPRDDVKAFEWFHKAATQGESRAQNAVGLLYMLGEGVPKDDFKAAEWTQKAAVQGEEDAQFRLGMAYLRGLGVATDNVLAYAWSNLANAKGVKEAWNTREIAASKMSPAEIAEAQRLSSAWKVGVVLARESSSARGGKQTVSPGGLVKENTGTAFIVNAAGNAITNHHVVEGCTEVRAEGRNGVVKVVTSDLVNDLAQLQIPGAVSAQAPIASNPAKLRQGEDIVVFGFPLNAVLSSGGNLTPGVVSALTGFGNNTNQIQITAPIQPGSSGSPVINMKGEVVGVVAMKLSDSKMAKATGQVGQNVNFAVSGQTLKTFLDTHNIDYGGSGMFSFGSKSTADLADEARKWTLVVECWK